MTNQTNKQNAGKSPVFQGCFAYFPRALKAVAMVSQYGKTKYKAPWTKKGWLQVAEGDLLDAQCRHILDRVIEGDVNHTDGDVLHQAQVVWEALAALEISLRAEEAAPFVKLPPVEINKPDNTSIDTVEAMMSRTGQFDDVMGDVMDARVAREKDGVSTIVPYQPSPGARYVVPGGFDLETKTYILLRDEAMSMSWHDYFCNYVTSYEWPVGFEPKETKQ